MTAPVLDLAVIGVGNVLRGDDAVGVRVIEGLRKALDRDADAVPVQTRLVDGGVLGLDLLATMRDARALVLVDAVHLGRAAGTVSVLRGDEFAAVAGACRANSPGAVGELLATARLLGWLPADVAMVGIEVADTEVGIGLSPAVGGALPAAMNAVRAELRRMDAIPADNGAGDGDAPRMAGTTS